jgi:hypothetical protein
MYIKILKKIFEISAKLLKILPKYFWLQKNRIFHFAPKKSNFPFCAKKIEIFTKIILAPKNSNFQNKIKFCAINLKTSQKIMKFEIKKNNSLLYNFL